MSMATSSGPTLAGHRSWPSSVRGSCQMEVLQARSTSNSFREVQVLIAALCQTHRRGVLFVQALLNHQEVSGAQVVEARGHGAGPPVVGALALGVGDGL